MAATLSPCIGICRINAQAGLCEGCFRTRQEIAEWPALLPEQRRQLLLELEKRQAEVALPQFSG